MSALVVKPRWHIGDYVSGSHEPTGWKATLEDAAKVLRLRSVWECDHYHERESAAQECGDREQARRVVTP